MWFIVNTNDEDFDNANITASYIETTGDTCYVKVSSLGHICNNADTYYAFYMPERNVDVNLYTGKKYKITSSVPERFGNDCEILHVEYGVAGAKIPFFVTYNDIEREDVLQNPVITYLPEGYSEWVTEEVNPFLFVDQRGLQFPECYVGSFVMPEAEVEICEFDHAAANYPLVTGTTSIDNATMPAMSVGKYLYDGRLIIVRNGKTYDVIGNRFK